MAVGTGSCYYRLSSRWSKQSSSFTSPQPTAYKPRQLEVNDVSMTIEWVQKNAYGLILRLDLSRRQLPRISGEEAVSASMFFYHGDDDGPILGHLDYRASERCRGQITFRHSTRPEEWATFIGDVIAHWDPEWRVTSTTQCRFGLWDEWRTKMRWERITPGNLLVVQHLARIRGAIEQFTQPTMGVDARFVLGAATNRLQSLIRRSNEEVRSQFGHL